MKFLKILFMVLVIAGLGFAGYRYISSSKSEGVHYDGIASVNGRMEMKRVDVGSLYAGRIERIPVEEGDKVAAGDILVELSSAQTEAQVSTARAQKKRSQEAVSKQLARIRQQETDMKLAALELREAEKLRSDRLISDTELQRRQIALDVKKENINVLKKELAEIEAEVKRADASLNEAVSRHNDMTVRAPIAGFVEYRLTEPGNVIGAGGKVVSLLDPSDVTLDVFLPTARVAGVRVGDEARITLDGLDAVFPARVDYVAREAQYTPKFVETSEERSKLLFRVSLRIDKELTEKYPLLFRGGMPAEGYVNYGGVSWPEDLAVNMVQADRLYDARQQHTDAAAGNSEEKADR